MWLRDNFLYNKKRKISLSNVRINDDNWCQLVYFTQARDRHLVGIERLESVRLSFSL